MVEVGVREIDEVGEKEGAAEVSSTTKANTEKSRLMELGTNSTSSEL